MEISQEHFFELFDFIRKNSFKPALLSIISEKFKHLDIDDATLEIIIKLVLENDSLANDILLIIIEKLNVKIEYNVKIGMETGETQHKKNVISKCFEYLDTRLRIIILDADVTIRWSSSSIYPPKGKVQITNEDPITTVEPKSEGYRIRGDILIETPYITLLSSNVRYKGRLRLINNKDVIVNFQDGKDLKEIFAKFLPVLYSPRIYTFMGIFAHFSFLNDMVLDIISCKNVSNGTNSLIKEIKSQKKIQITAKEGTSDITVNCEHNDLIEEYLNGKEYTKDMNVLLLNFFKVVGGLAYCNLCGQRIESFLVFEYAEQTFLVPNENIIYKKPYSNYIGLDIFVDDFMIHFQYLTKINFTQYTPLIIMRLVDEIESISDRRIQLEEEYKKKNVIPDYIFFSRLNIKYFNINPREDSYYTNLRHYYTNLYLFYMIFALMSMEDFNNVLRKLLIKTDTSMMHFMCRTCAVFLTRFNLNIFEDSKLATRLVKTFDIIGEILSVQYSNLIEVKDSKFIYFSTDKQQILVPIDNKIKLPKPTILSPIIMSINKENKTIASYFEANRPIIRIEEDMCKKNSVSILQPQKINKKLLEVLYPLYDQLTYYYNEVPVKINVDGNLIRLIGRRSTIVEVFNIGELFDISYLLPDSIDKKTVELFDFFHKSNPYLFLSEFSDDVAFDIMEAFISEIERYEDLTIWYPTQDLPTTRDGLTEFKLSLFNKEVEEFYNK